MSSYLQGAEASLVAKHDSEDGSSTCYGCLSELTMSGEDLTQVGLALHIQCASSHLIF